VHTRDAQAAPPTETKKPEAPPKAKKQAEEKKLMCNKCGKEHKTKDCKFDGACNYCTKKGNMCV